MIRVLTLLALLTACATTPTVTPDAFQDGVTLLEAALDEVRTTHTEGRPRAAVAAWHQAHRAWDDAIDPGLSDTVPEHRRIVLELHLARIRAALDAGNDPGPAIDAFQAALEEPIAQARAETGSANAAP